MGIILGEFYNNIDDKPINISLLESYSEDRDTIIFDLGSVLIDGNFTKSLYQDPRIPNEYIEELKSYWIMKDSSFTENCTKDQYIKKVMDNTPEHLKYFIPVIAEISSSYLQILPHTYSLLNNLRKDGYSLYYLSNWNRWSVEELKRQGKFDFLNLFDGGLFSYECGYMKPDEKIYITFLNKYKLDPFKCIFFDDRKENIDAANKLGIQGIQFNEETGCDILKDFLLNESYIEESKSSSNMPKKCTKCGSTNIGIFICGEPIYKCKDCGAYLGTVPFSSKNESTDIMEKAMTAKERNALSDDDFGIPELRKYPLHDKVHVQQAIRMFNHVEKKYEAELADNILDAMEKYHISTDTVGDKNRLKKYIKEETSYISEGLIWNDNTPKDINKLKEDIKNELKESVDLKDIVDMVKDSLKNRDFSSDEKKAIYKVMKKLHVDIHGYTIKTATKGSVEISNTHQIIGTFKNYILTIRFIGSRGNIGLNSIIINYDKDKCEIPKNVAFDFISIMSPYVDKVKTTKRSIKISALSKAIDSGYPRVYHKYGNKYSVKKSFGGLYVILSTLKFTNESSPVAAALPRQDYQPDAVYIVNYLKKNTFESDLAVCKDKMNSIFICNNGEPSRISLSDFKDMVSETKVYKFIGDSSFDHIVRLSSCGLDFYKNMVEDQSVTIESLETDYRFKKVPSYIDELNSIEECIINSAPKSGIVNEIYCPIIPLINENTDESSVHFFRDIDGVFAQNIDTLARSASYNSISDIPESTISILKNI